MLTLHTPDKVSLSSAVCESNHIAGQKLMRNLISLNTEWFFFDVLKAVLMIVVVVVSGFSLQWNLSCCVWFN